MVNKSFQCVGRKVPVSLQYSFLSHHKKIAVPCSLFEWIPIGTVVKQVCNVALAEFKRIE